MSNVTHEDLLRAAIEAHARWLGRPAAVDRDVDVIRANYALQSAGYELVMDCGVYHLRPIALAPSTGDET